MFTKVYIYDKHKSNIKEVFLEQLIQRAEKKIYRHWKIVSSKKYIISKVV